MAKDPYRYFRIEARELLDQLGEGALALEKGQGGEALVGRMLRQAHTLKGAARVVRQAAIADLIHGVEGLLEPYREGAPALPRAVIDALLAACDGIGALLARLPGADGTPAPAAPAPPAGAAPRVAHADALEVAALLEGLGEIGGELAGLRRALAQLGAARGAAVPQAGLEAAEGALGAGIERIGRELRAAREAAERLRLAPVSAIFHALERTARDAAHGLGREVVFEARGGALRLDGGVLDAVQGALLQLVRNAVAHGIEAPAARAAAGKPAAGRITLEVTRCGERICFRCADDGAGIDLDAVRRVLAARGEPAGAAGDDSAALLARLLAGGVSTSASVSELSGRGIGLDVVRAAAAALHGEVRASSVAGQGCAFELWLPLALAALDVLLVEADGQQLALPLDAVRGTLRVARHEIAGGADGERVAWRGQSIALLPLSLGLRGAGAAHRWPARALTAVVLDGGHGPAALAVARLCGIENVVLRALPALAPAAPLVLGLHLDSEGYPRPVLDPRALGGARDGAARAPAAPPRLPVLIVDDSLTTRMLESSILESAGFAVLAAASAEEGLALARRTPCALFLVDLEMPGMDGFGFIESARAEPLLAHIPAILVTSCDSPEHRRRGAEAGAAAYIVKSRFDQADFLQRVSALVQR